MLRRKGVCIHVEPKSFGVFTEFSSVTPKIAVFTGEGEGAVHKVYISFYL
jgi:hypothetical protein